ncbi:MAG: invasion associated locus B family protein [Pseudomonadota bacterium]
MKRILMAGAVSAIAGSGAFVAAPVDSAQAQGLRSNGWYKACSDQGNSKICNVQYQAVASTGQVVTSVNLAEISGEVERRVFQITVPTGRLIPPGIELQVDGKKANSVPYTFCTPRICAAEVTLNDELVGILKAGGEMVLTSTNFQGKKNPIPVTLSGFTAAYDGPPIQQEELQSRQQQLADELQKKAAEAKKKLDEAQKAATQGTSEASE